MVQLNKMHKCTFDLLVTLIFRGRPRNNNNIHSSSYLLFMEPVCFPDKAGQPVANNTIAYFLADGKPDPELPAFRKEQHQITAGNRMSLPVNILKRSVFLQPIPSFHALNSLPLHRKNPGSPPAPDEEKPAH